MGYSIEDFLTIPVAVPKGFSPDGTQVLVGANPTGMQQLYVVPRRGGDAVQITDDDEPVEGTYMPATDEVLLTRSAGGNERTQIYLMSADGEQRRPVAVDPDHIHNPGAIAFDGSMIAYSTDRRTGSDFDVVVHDLATGDERTVFALGGWCSASRFSPDGHYLVVSRLTERNGDNDLYLVDLRSDDILHLTPHEGDAAYGSVAWLPDSSGFFFASDEGREFTAIARYDLATAEAAGVVEDGWDLTCGIDRSGRRLFVTANEDGYVRRDVYDPHTLEHHGSLTLPRAGGLSTSMSHDGTWLAFAPDGATRPSQVWLRNLDAGGEDVSLMVPPSPVDPSTFVEPELVRVPSFDGEPIALFVYRPTAIPDGGAPVVVFIHGGPESQFRPTFNPVIQYLVYRGYAVVAPNVRGSTGYGKRFHHLDDVERRMDSVMDLEAIYVWLSGAQGLDHRRAVLWGGSYGGYMVLAGLAFQPGLWAAGVDIVGISNLVTFLENTAPWRRRFREREYGSLDRDRPFLETASPISRVDQMRAPLFIIHGRNDPRVPVGEAEQIHAALRERNVPCELLIYDDEGHGLAKRKNRLDAFPRAVDFLDRVLDVGSAR